MVGPKMQDFCPRINILKGFAFKQSYNEKAQMANFSVLAKGRRPRQELFAKTLPEVQRTQKLTP